MSNVINHPDPNGPFLGRWMDARYKQADAAAAADFRARQAARAEAVKESNIQSRAVAKKAAQAFQEESK